MNLTKIESKILSELITDEAINAMANKLVMNTSDKNDFVFNMVNLRERLRENSLHHSSRREKALIACCYRYAKKKPKY